MKIARNLTAAALLLILLLLLALWFPVTPRFATQPQPAQDYVDAMRRIEAWQAREGDDLFPQCRSTLLTHRAKMTRTIVFFHGISNCPAQFALLGQHFYEIDYNVLIPRLPHHGMADRMSDETANLTAEELVAIASESVDIAAGLGDEITVAGFSSGGVMAAWVAAERPEVDQTVLISPFLSPRRYPGWMVAPLTRLLLILPNQFWWWDEVLQEEIPGPRFAQPRYPSHAVAHIMRLSLAVRRYAQRSAPPTRRILSIRC